MKQLIAAGADINKPDRHGYTPLVNACKKVPGRPLRTEVAEFLVLRGAKLPQPVEIITDKALRARLVEIKDSFEVYPIHAALRRSEIDEHVVLETIRSAWRSVCQLDQFNETPFMIAARLPAVSMRVKTEILVQACRVLLGEYEPTCSEAAPRCPEHHLAAKSSSFPSLRYHARGSGLWLDSGATPQQQPSTTTTTGRRLFEVTIEKMAVVQVGLCLGSRWGPSSANDGAGDGPLSWALDGKRRCIWAEGRQVPLAADCFPGSDWTEGVVAGVLVDAGQRSVTFFVNGRAVHVLAIGGAEAREQECIIPVVTIQQPGEVTCNFGEKEFKFPPQSEFVSWHSAGGGVRGFMEVYSVATSSWHKAVPADGVLSRWHHDWASAVSVDSNAELLRLALTRLASSVFALVNTVTDDSGRRISDVAALACRKQINSFVFFMGRYEFLTPLSRPEHKSNTCVVMICRDHDADESSGAATKTIVALKIMKNRLDFETELQSRRSIDSKQYVVAVLASFDGDADDEVRNQLKNRGLGDYRYCISLEAAERTLQRILLQENIAARDWPAVRHIFSQLVRGVSSLHDTGVVHGDLKPLNVMRNSLGNMVLIDLDASVLVNGSNRVSDKRSTGFVPPEMVSLDPISGQCSTRSTEVARYTHDIWSLGVILFQMCSGEPLFLCNDSDDIDQAQLLALRDWGDGFKGAKLQKISNAHARNLVSRLLSKEESKRPSVSAILAHPFVSGRAAQRLVGDVPSYDVFLSVSHSLTHSFIL